MDIGARIDSSSNQVREGHELDITVTNYYYTTTISSHIHNNNW